LSRLITFPRTSSFSLLASAPLSSLPGAGASPSFSSCFASPEFWNCRAKLTEGSAKVVMASIGTIRLSFTLLKLSMTWMLSSSSLRPKNWY
jgi:hypothetical protein